MTHGPSWKMTVLGMNDFTIQYVEWITVAALGSNAVLAVAEGTPYYIGNYLVADGTFVNPLNVMTTPDTT